MNGEWIDKDKRIAKIIVLQALLFLQHFLISRACQELTKELEVTKEHRWKSTDEEDEEW